MRVVGYARLSKAEGGHGIETQHDAIRSYCRRRGFDLVRIESDDGISGRSMRKREGLTQALEACRRERIGAIVSTRVDRLARSSLDFHTIVQDVSKSGATVLFTEQESLSLDTPEGRMLVGILASFAQFERDLVSARTKSALAHVKRNGSRSGRPIGNPHFRPVLPDVQARILAMRRGGMSYEGIARVLTSEGVPTAQGGRWFGATIRNVCKRATGERASANLT